MLNWVGFGRDLTMTRLTWVDDSFYPNGRTSSHVRTSFSLVDLDEDADVGMERLAGAIKDWQRENGQ